MNTSSIIILAFFIFPALSLKILSIGEKEEDEEFNITIKNPPPLIHSEFSFCWWVKYLHHGYHVYLGNYDEGKSILIKDQGYGKYLWLNSIWEISFPGNLQITPHTWMFFCIIFDKNEKTLEFYLNSLMIYKEEMSMFFDKVEWETEFLRKNIKFMGQSPSNNITGLSLWAGALRAEDITSLYDCKQEHSHADILSWEDVEFDVSPETSKIQILESENEEEPCKDQVDFFRNGQQERSIKEVFCSRRKDGCVC